MSHSSVLALANETGAEFLQALRAPEFLVPTVLLPGIFYSMFGILLSKGGTAGYLLATYGVFAVTGPALFGFGVGVASEREKGWLELKRVMPASGLHYITAKLLTTLIFATFALLPIYALAGFVGDVAMTRMQWLTLASVHLLAVAPFSLVGLMLGFSFGSGGAV
ncbi:MAG: ABC transporter permease, partial [Pseudomonadota bacterium]